MKNIVLMVSTLLLALPAVAAPTVQGEFTQLSQLAGAYKGKVSKLIPINETPCTVIVGPIQNSVPTPPYTEVEQYITVTITLDGQAPRAFTVGNTSNSEIGTNLFGQPENHPIDFGTAGSARITADLNSSGGLSDIKGALLQDDSNIGWTSCNDLQSAQ